MAFLLASLASANARAEVLRCIDARGKTTYTNDPCPRGSRSVRRLEVPDAPPALSDAELAARREDEAARERRSSEALRDSEASIARQLRLGSRAASPGAVGTGRDALASPPGASVAEPIAEAPPSVLYGGDVWRGGQWIDRGPRDLRAPLRNCDRGGCTDTLGNHFDRTGQLNRYRSLDGKTCQPVGTTTICR